jgi:hypothetical protein
MLEALPQQSLRDKLAYLREYFGRSDVNVEAARRELGFGAPIELPDDIALLVVQRGGELARA